jgi:hypothetical protein
MEPAKEEPEQNGAAQPEPSRRAPSKREPAQKRTARREPSKRAPSKREPAWRKAARTFQEEPSSESAADNGHEKPTTDRSP